MNEKSVRICPKCQATDVYVDSDNQGMSDIAGITTWICNQCDFRGRFFPLIDEKSVRSLEKE